MKPILFNTNMVRAVLDGRKTVTRRAVKPQPPSETHPRLFVTAPYHPGDILYVRETWQEKRGVVELLGQATEECCELGQVCQKLRRVMKGTTPVKLDDASKKLDEEVGDVLLLIDCLAEMGIVDLDAAMQSARRKIERWYGRTFGEGE